MSWTHSYPLGDGVDLQDPRLWADFLKALTERDCPAFGAKRLWPRESFNWGDAVGTGNISALTATYLDDAGGSFFSLGGSASAPSTYAIILDAVESIGDQRAIYRTGTIATDSNTRFTFPDLEENNADFRLNWIGRGYSYGGFDEYRVINDSLSNRHWGERVFDYPVDFEYAIGTVREIISDTSVALDLDYLIKGLRSSFPGSPAAFDLIIRDSNIRWQRAAISTWTTDNVVTFSRTTMSGTGWVSYVGADAYIVERNAWWHPERRTLIEEYDDATGARRLRRSKTTMGFDPSVWYTGIFNADVSHSPENDALALMNAIATDEIEVNRGTTICEDEIITIFDDDGYTDQDDECEGEQFHNPNVQKSPRAKQKRAEDLSGSFVEKKSWGGASRIYTMTRAEWFRYFLSGNTTTATITAGSSGSATASITMPAETASTTWTALECHWTILDGSESLDGVDGIGNVTASGLTHVTDGTPFDFSPHVGKTLLIAFSWTRWWERKFQYLFDRTYLEPDVDAVAVIPPTSDFPGNWSTRTKSTNYLERNDHGAMIDGRAFVNGEAARLVGDNWWDPFMEGVTDPDDAGIQAIGRGLWEGKPSSISGWFDPPKRGVVTESNAISVRCGGIGWWDGALIAHEWTAGAGSSSTVNATSIAGTEPGFWDGVGRDWTMFILEVEDERRPITGYNSATKTLTVGTAFSTTSTGKTARIREPGDLVLNRWKDRVARFTTPTGATIEKTITRSDDEYLYFTTGDIVPIGSSVEIIDQEFGAVYVRSGGNWIRSDSPSAPADTRGRAWTSSATYNMPTLVRGFGKMRAGDLLMKHIPNELHDGIVALAWTIGIVAWTTREDDSTPEDNFKEAVEFQATSEAYAGNCAKFKSDLDTEWALASPSEFGTVGPTVGTSINYNGDGTSNAAASTQYMWASVTLGACLAHTVEMWVYCGVNGADEVPGTYIDPGSPPATWRKIAYDASAFGAARHTWTAIGSIGPTASANSRIRVGDASLARPAWADCPEPLGVTTSDDYYQYSQSLKGAAVLDERALVKWDVAGGLEYL